MCSVVLGTAPTTTTQLDAEKQVVIDYEMGWSQGTWRLGSRSQGNLGSWIREGPWLWKQKAILGWLAVGSLAG